METRTGGFMKDHKTSTENKTGTRLRMEAARPKSVSVQPEPSKSKKKSGPKGSPADKRSRQRQAADQHEKERAIEEFKELSGWFGFNLVSLGLMIAAGIAGNWVFVLLLLLLSTIYNKLSRRYDKLKETK